MNFDDIRRLIIVALFADDELMQRIVLKGGNALTLIYKLSSRASLDLDFSMENDFEDVDAIRQRIFRTLKDRFDSAGYVVFDERLDVKPKLSGPDERPWWGGYELKFKLIEKKKHTSMRNKPDKMRIDALVVGPNQQRVFTVDLSKCEYTKGKRELELDHYTIYVYTPAMVAIEKLRAICQQMPEYEVKGLGIPRARDFFDIHLVLSKEGVDFAAPENLDLIRGIFEAKKVPLRLIGKIRDQRDFHRPDWPSVVASVSGDIQDFDFYFNFVAAQVGRLKSLWEEQAPV